MLNSVVDPSIISAYVQAHYRIHAPQPFIMKIEEENPELKRLLKMENSTSCAFITATNPHSHKLTAEENQARQAELARELKTRNLTYITGEGKDPSCNWPGEPGYLIFNISLETAKEIGRKYEQNAIVFAGQDAVPKLELLR